MCYFGHNFFILSDLERSKRRIHIRNSTPADLVKCISRCENLFVKLTKNIECCLEVSISPNIHQMLADSYWASNNQPCLISHCVQYVFFVSKFHFQLVSHFFRKNSVASGSKILGINTGLDSGLERMLDLLAPWLTRICYILRIYWILMFIKWGLVVSPLRC